MRDESLFGGTPESKVKLSQLGEFGLIKLIKSSQTKHHGTIIGIGDDAAVLTPSVSRPPQADSRHLPLIKGENKKRGLSLLITTDALVENVHFKLKKTSFYDLGYYSLFVNVSDIAAMGGYPTHAFVTLALPKETNVADVKEFYRGLNTLAKKVKIDVAGGDTTASASGWFISITLLGEVERENLLTRSGAKVGDLIAVTGRFGGAAQRKFKIQSSRLKVMIKESLAIARSQLATAMIDSSDGLVRSILEISKASKIGAIIDEAKVPIAKGATLQQALHGGEEYELVFTLPRKNFDKIQKLFGRNELTAVGEIVSATKKVGIRAQNGKITKIAKGGFEHFR
ncbi:thiamine-phosphate kinase [Candidatus Saganbacteria bacterium]|nr:thiamine-phosphate kinase [Candidatus Saganbacteria bacterium]